MVESRPSKPLVASSNLVSRSIRAHIAQSAEHFLGKEEVTGSSPVMGSYGFCAPFSEGKRRYILRG